MSAGIMNEVAGIAFGKMQFWAGLHMLRGAAFITEMHLELYINELSEKEALELHTLSVNSPVEEPSLGFISEHSDRFSFE